MIAGTYSRVGTVKNQLRVFRGKSEFAAKTTNVCEVDVGLPDDGYFLACAVITRFVKRRDVVNGGDVVGREIVGAARSCVVGSNSLGARRFEVEVIETLQSRWSDQPFRSGAGYAAKR